MGRAPCCDKANVKKGPWSPEEDAKLKAYIEQHGTGGNWIALPQKIGLKRCGKSCRLRWLNYLRPNIKHGGFSEEEDNIICSLYVSIGSRWSIIAAQLPGRTDNDIKNYWNTRLKKKLLGKQRKEQQAQARVKQDMIKRESEAQNLAIPLNQKQTPNWAAQLSLPIQQPYNSHTLTHTIDSHHYPYRISFPLSQPQDHLFPTSINTSLIDTPNTINTSICQSTNMFECLNELSELVCANNPPPQQVDAALQGYYGMGSTGSASTESSSWGDITSNLLYSPLLSEYEGGQQGIIMPQEVAFHESSFFGMQ